MRYNLLLYSACSSNLIHSTILFARNTQADATTTTTATATADTTTLQYYDVQVRTKLTVITIRCCHCHYLRCWRGAEKKAPNSYKCRSSKTIQLVETTCGTVIVILVWKWIISSMILVIFLFLNYFAISQSDRPRI